MDIDDSTVITTIMEKKVICVESLIRKILVHLRTHFLQPSYIVLQYEIV